MARLIDVNELMSEVHRYDEQQKTDVWLTSDIAALLAEQPTVDAVEVVHGRWLTIEEFAEKIGADSTGYSGGWVYCSECDQPMRDINGWHYCPNCGAKMDGERKDNED